MIGQCNSRTTMFDIRYHEWLDDFLSYPSQNSTQNQQHLSLLDYISSSIDGKSVDEIKKLFDESQHLTHLTDEALKRKMVDQFDTLNDPIIMGVTDDKLEEFYLFVKDGADKKMAFIKKKLSLEIETVPKEELEKQLVELMNCAHNKQPLKVFDTFKKYKPTLESIYANLVSQDMDGMGAFKNFMAERIDVLDNNVPAAHLDTSLFELQKDLTRYDLKKKAEILDKDEAKKYSAYPILWMRTVHDRIYSEGDDTELLAYQELMSRIRSSAGVNRIVFVQGGATDDEDDDNDDDLESGSVQAAGHGAIAQQGSGASIGAVGGDTDSDSDGNSDNDSDDDADMAASSGASVASQQIIPFRASQMRALAAVRRRMIVNVYDMYQMRLRDNTKKFLTDDIVKRAVLNRDLKLGSIATAAPIAIELWNDYFELDRDEIDEQVTYNFLNQLLQSENYSILTLALDERYGGIDKETRNTFGDTLLHSFFAKINFDSDINFQQLQYLLKKDFSLGQENYYGDTPLHLLLKAKKRYDGLNASFLSGLFSIIKEYDDQFTQYFDRDGVSLLGHLLSQCGTLAHDINEFYELFVTNKPYQFESGYHHELPEEYALRHGNDDLACILLDKDQYEPSRYSLTHRGMLHLLDIALDECCIKSAKILSSRLTRKELDTIARYKAPLLMSIRNYERPKSSDKKAQSQSSALTTDLAATTSNIVASAADAAAMTGTRVKSDRPKKKRKTS